MIVSVAYAVAFVLLAVSFYLIFKEVSVPDVSRQWIVVLMMISTVLSLCTFNFSGQTTSVMLTMQILPALSGMLLLSSSLWSRKQALPLCIGLLLVEFGSFCYNLALASGWLDGPAQNVMLVLIGIYAMIPVLLSIVGLFLRLRGVRMIVKTGTIWSNVCLSVDMLYLAGFVALSYLYILLLPVCGQTKDAILCVFPCLLGLMLAALGIREADGVLFVVWRRQERTIVESMKVTKVESAVDPSGIDDVYKDVYERLVAYFELEHPFLDSSLTINDLVKALYSNKLYISRAISQFTGRNFCQFVNYYRVTYSMELFRKDLSLKIHDLACASGFNSDVSYNMAFRLFMGETPGEWCRKERSRSIKQKK